MASFAFMSTSPNEYTINALAGSGLAFMGVAFGDSVPVGEYQTTTWISNGNGTTNGAQVNNVKYLDTASGILNSASSGVGLLSIPNYLSTLIIEFSHSSAVRLQNTKLYIYDRASVSNPPSGVLCKVAEIIHPDVSQVGATGSGSPLWLTPAGSSYMSLTPSPGRSGLYVNGPMTTDTYHTHYVALSANPSSIGSKTQFGLYVETEYL